MRGTPTQSVLVTKAPGILSESEGGDMIDDARERVTVEGEERGGVGGRPRMLLSNESCGVRLSLLELDSSATARQSSCDGVILLLSERLDLFGEAVCIAGPPSEVRRFAGRASRALIW